LYDAGLLKNLLGALGNTSVNADLDFINAAQSISATDLMTIWDI
jgi:hypothetical protein